MQGPQPGDLLARRYRVIRPLGSGAYGVVFECMRIDDGLKVAVKLMHYKLGGNAVAYQRFEREAQTVQRLQHPNIVVPMDYGLANELAYIAFELLDGVTLRTELEARGALGIARAAQIARQLLSALACAHAAGVVHRDVKPANLFLCRRRAAGEELKVLDFGIAKANDERSLPTLTGTGQLLGTPQYMAPEQVRGQRDVDARADVYAAGTVLAEMMSGRKLVAADSDIEVFMAHISDEPLTIPPDVAGSLLGHVVARAVAKRPGDRYPDAAAMLADIDLVIPHLGAPSTWPHAAAPSLALGPDGPSVAPSETTSVLPPPAEQTFQGGDAPTLPSHPPPHASSFPPVAPFPVGPPPVGHAPLAYYPPPPPVPQTASVARTSAMPLILAIAVAAALVLGAGAGVVAWTLARTGTPPRAAREEPDDGHPLAAQRKRVRQRLRDKGFVIDAEFQNQSEHFAQWGATFHRGHNYGNVQLLQFQDEQVAKSTRDNMAKGGSIIVEADGKRVTAMTYPVDARRLLRDLTDP